MPGSVPLYTLERSCLTCPALIDCHVHFREPGLEHKANMKSEAVAAYYGGITVVCDMPNTQPPTQSIAALSDKVNRAAAASKKVHFYFFLGATAPGHLAELEALWTQPRWSLLKPHCCGLKLYLDNSTGNMKSCTVVTEAAFALCGRLSIPLVAHCEQAEINDAAAKEVPYTTVDTHSLRRPSESEVASVAYAIGLARQHRTPLHIAHLSTAGGLDLIREARAADPELRLTCEVTPHHLFLSTDDYVCCGARVKVNPPLRHKTQHQNALWEGVLDGTIDCVSTDHAPHTQTEKDAPDGQPPPSGMPGVELVVPLLLTVAAGAWPHPRTTVPAALLAKPLTYDRIVEMMHTNPNRIFGLGLSSTTLVRQFQTSTKWTVDEDLLHSHCRWSPYNGWHLVGKAIVTEGAF